MSGIETDSRPLRVLHVGKYFPPHRGGMETYLRDLMSVQKRDGLEVAALVHSSKRAVIDLQRSEDALDGTCFTIVESARWFNIGYVPVSPFFALSAAKIIRNFKPDVIHLHLPNASVIWLLLLYNATRIRWFCSWHSDILTPKTGPLMRLAYSFFKIFENAVLGRCRAIFATSPPYADSSIPLSKYQDKVQILPLGLDAKRLPDVEDVQIIKTEKHEKTVLTVGRMSRYKNLPQLVSAIAAMIDTNLWLAGDGEMEAALHQLVREQNLQDRVTFWGNVDTSTLWQLMASCDVFCLPSDEKTEAFGMVLLEASYMMKPVVVNHIEGSGVPWVAKMIGGTVIHDGDFATALREATPCSGGPPEFLFLKTPRYS